MAGVVPNQAERNILGILVNSDAVSTIYLKLYNGLGVTDPVEGTNLASLSQVTLGSGGYAPVPLTAANWSINTAADITTASHSQITFTFTGSIGEVYGYYLTYTNPERLMLVESFSAGPYNITQNGDQIKITLNTVLS